MANSEIALVMENLEEKAEATLPTENPKEKAEATLLAENPEEKITSNNPDSSSKDIKEESAVEDNHESRRWSPEPYKIHKVKSIQNYWINFIQIYWIEIFVASCLCGVLVDPLFLYVPMIKDDVKCLFLDQKLKIVAVILRSVTDLIYILDIIFRIYGSETYWGFIEELRFRPSGQRYCAATIAKAIWESNDILIDILAILPVPQVIILILFSNMRDLRSLTTTRMLIMNLFALFQYVPRILRIYLSCSELNKIPKGEIKQTPIWIKATLNFAMYIIASHVYGAIWYFFAIQRMMNCWHFACGKEDECDISSFGCYDHRTFRHSKILDDFCPINPSNAKMFDLGIFTSVIESGITGSTNYVQKFSNCFWWGLRNLSSLGSNLEPSINEWENLFTASVSIIGLLLFVYLIGNLQMYMQKEMQIQMQIEIAEIEKQRKKREEHYRKLIAERKKQREKHCRKLRVTRKAEKYGREIELWLFKNGIPTKSHEEMKLQVMGKVRKTIQGNRVVNLDNVLHTLPSDFQSRIRKCTPLTKLNNVFEGLDERVLREICQHLEPYKFKKNDIIFKEGKPEVMVFIVDGLVDIVKRNSDGSCNNSQRGVGELCGQDHLLCGSRSNGDSAKALGDVDALVIRAKDMESVRSRFREQIYAYELYLRWRYVNNL